MRIWEGVLCRKCFQIAFRNVFLIEKLIQNAKKSACGEHIVIEIRLVMLIKCNFSAPAAGQNHSVFEFYDCLQGATRQATLLLMLTRFRRGQKTLGCKMGNKDLGCGFWEISDGRSRSSTALRQFLAMFEYITPQKITSGGDTSRVV